MMFSTHLRRLARIGFHKNSFERLRKYATSTSTCSIIEHYQRRLESILSQNLSIVESDGVCQNNNLTHHIILTARPDEFEKLPPKCSACGVFLQSEFEDAHGFIPEKKMKEGIENDFSNGLVCYSCYQLRYYNKPSLVNHQNNEEIFNQVSHLRRIKALVLYVIDVFNIEGSLLDNIVSLIGGKKRVIIVVNKVDRLPQDDSRHSKQLERMKDLVKKLCIENGLSESNFRDICFVSARTGYGVHTLVQKINKFRDNNMDVYLVGCTNTGKSTLYNLLVNLLNVHKNEKLPSQAIEHYTAGCTKSLLRQPISMRRLLRLDNRLKNGPWEEAKVFEFDEDFLSFMDVNEKNMHLYRNIPMLSDPNKSLGKRKVELIDKKNRELKQNYIYDTPGILKPQVTEYLENDELKALYPTSYIVPRTLIMKPGDCLFLGGLARLDFDKIWKPKVDDVSTEDFLAQASQSIFVTVMMSPNLPLHTSFIKNAEAKYESLFVNNILKIPKGRVERWQQFPSLQRKNYTVIGKNLNINSSDIVLFGVGWLSIGAVSEARVDVSFHTPNAIGQCFRREPLLPYSLRKKSGRGVSYLGRTNHKMYGHTRKNSPSFIRVFQQQNDTTYAWKKKIIEKLKVEKFAKREEARLKRVKNGVILGKWRAIKEKERQLMNLLETSNERQ